MKLALMYLLEIICEFAFDDKALIDHSETLSKIY